LFAETEDHETVLAATSKLHNSQTNSGLEVKYAVSIRLVMKGTSDIHMTLPFVIESPRPCGAGGK
jgi:hypothetical protein